MIRRKEDRNVEYREHMRGGDGTVKITNVLESGEYKVTHARPMAVDISSSRLRISVVSSWLFLI